VLSVIFGLLSRDSNGTEFYIFYRWQYYYQRMFEMFYRCFTFSYIGLMLSLPCSCDFTVRSCLSVLCRL